MYLERKYFRGTQDNDDFFFFSELVNPAGTRCKCQVYVKGKEISGTYFRAGYGVLYRIQDYIARRIQETGYRMQGTGCRIQDAGYRMQDAGCRIQDTGYRMQDYITIP